MATARTRRPPSRPGPAARRLPVMPIALAVVVLFGILAVALSRGGGDDVPAGVEQTRSVTISGEALARHDDGIDAALGATVPEVEGESFDGAPVAIRRDGTPKLILFLAHWCPHCQNEVPVISDWLAEKGKPEGVELISVSTQVNQDQPNYPPSSWLEREKWEVPVVADDADSSTAEAFGLSAFPFFVAVDGEGRVVARTSGELEVDALEALVTQARGRPVAG